MYQTYYVYIDKDYDPCFLMFSKKNIIIFLAIHVGKVSECNYL